MSADFAIIDRKACLVRAADDIQDVNCKPCAEWLDGAMYSSSALELDFNFRLARTPRRDPEFSTRRVHTGKACYDGSSGSPNSVYNTTDHLRHTLYY